MFGKRWFYGWLEFNQPEKIKGISLGVPYYIERGLMISKQHKNKINTLKKRVKRYESVLKKEWALHVKPLDCYKNISNRFNQSSELKKESLTLMISELYLANNSIWLKYEGDIPNEPFGKKIIQSTPKLEHMIRITHKFIVAKMCIELLEKNETINYKYFDDKYPMWRDIKPGRKHSKLEKIINRIREIFHYPFSKIQQCLRDRKFCIKKSAPTMKQILSARQEYNSLVNKETYRGKKILPASFYYYKGDQENNNIESRYAPPEIISLNQHS